MYNWMYARVPIFISTISNAETSRDDITNMRDTSFYEEN